ncbi:hypothetical protein SASPL_144222 [Salvia splendens]|uniref:N-acetyltransferase domain-containing protein n=1 Tax=Salvia splendens TaxID=180675 RepID=A0A8X8WN35_SALSN|nr:hypothetical protein SASPL_144222 [Salvia splendens]
MLLHHHILPLLRLPNSINRRPAATTTASFSLSDKSLSSRGFTFHRTAENLNLDHLKPWDSRAATRRRSGWRWSTRRRWCGWSTGDGVFNAIIWDVVVDPSFQGFSLGKAVMERILTALLDEGITNIALYYEPRVLGFVADPDGIRGMVYSRKNKRKT